MADDVNDDVTLDEVEIDLGPADVTPEDVELNLDFGDDNEADDEIVLNLGDDEDEAEADDESGDADDEAVVAALREKLASQFGDWYVIHTYSGMENRVKQNLDARITTLGMEDFIFESVVPTEEVVEIRNGARKVVTRTVLPGYVLVRHGK